MKLPVKEPLIKAKPIIKLIGRFIVLLDIKLTFLVSELFCIPIINIKNKAKLKVKVNNNFFKINIILKINHFYKYKL